MKESEASFQRAVIDLAHLHNWMVFHARTSRTTSGGWATAVAADGAGFPDLVLVRKRTLFRELKTDRGRLSHAQDQWHARLHDAGADVGVWRPRDWERINRELSKEAL